MKKDIQNCDSHICRSNRILSIMGHTVDCFDAKYKTEDELYDYTGYVPGKLNIGGGDDIEMDICMECGKIQGKFPVSDDIIKKKIGRKGIPVLPRKLL